jgi:ABC-type sulfate transport system substrate-binding protein
MTLDNSFASDEDTREDYPETALAHIEASLSIDRTDIDYDSTAEQFHNLVLFLQQHAQQTNEKISVERDHGGRGTLASDTVTDGTLASDTVTDDTVQEGQATKFPQNSEDY